MKTSVLAVLALAVVICGCTHHMEVTNLKDYAVKPTEGPRIDVALASFKGSTPQDDICFGYVVEGLRSHPHVNQVRINWDAAVSEQGFRPSHATTLNLKSSFSGSGANFPITFPGFLVFACAWNGYVYRANIDAAISAKPIETAQNEFSKLGNAALKEAKADVKMPFRLRHCSFNRGFWSGTGWWFPGWGIHTIVVGGIFTGYDRRATADFNTAMKHEFGAYTAEKIVQTLLQGKAAEFAKLKAAPAQ